MSIHVKFSNFLDVGLASASDDALTGTWRDGFAAPTEIGPETAVEWETDGNDGGSVAYTIGDTGAQLTFAWRTSGGVAFDYDLATGYELLGTIDDVGIDVHLAPTGPHTVDGFAPSTHGFAFPNVFPEGLALREVDLGIVKIPIGKASNGLCGGMTFGARDYFEAGIAIPDQSDAPAGDGDALFDYLAQRLVDSFDLPHLPSTLMTIMNPGYPDHDGGLRNKLGAEGRARLMARTEFAKIRATIDEGKPCPICIVKAQSSNPAALGQHHQILVYGYQVDGTELTLWAYDPNNPGNDGAGLVLDIGHTDRTIEVGVSLSDLAPIYCFIATNYTPQTPPQ